MARTSNSRRTLAVALAALLAACVTGKDVEQAQASWQGASYEDVLRVWGAPSRSTRTADGREWHTWVNEVYAPPPTMGVGVGSGVGIGRRSSVGIGIGMDMPIGPPPPPERCERTLVFADGLLVDQAWNGPPTLCAPFKRP